MAKGGSGACSARVECEVLIAIIFIDWPAVIDKARGWWAVA